MTELKTKLVWNEVKKGEEWHAGGLARFYKIVYRPAAQSRGPADTSRTSFFSLYLSYPEGLDHYVTSASKIETLHDRAQANVDRLG